jgi:hypothetical protein
MEKAARSIFSTDAERQIAVRAEQCRARKWVAIRKTMSSNEFNWCRNSNRREWRTLGECHQLDVTNRRIRLKNVKVKIRLKCYTFKRWATEKAWMVENSNRHGNTEQEKRWTLPKHTFVTFCQFRIRLECQTRKSNARSKTRLTECRNGPTYLDRFK